MSGSISLEEAEDALFHRQGEMAKSGSILKYLKYIRSHDEFKQKKTDDYRQMPGDTSWQKAYYKVAKKSAEKRSARGLDSLFKMIERQEGIKALPIC